MDSSAHTLVFNRRSSGQSSSKGLPKSLSVSMRLCLLLGTQLCSQLTLLRDVKTVCHFLHSHSRTLQYILASSGSHTYHPASQSYWIFCKPNHSSFPFYSGIFLFMHLIKWYVYLKTFCDSRMLPTCYETCLSEGQVVTSCHPPCI